MQSGIFPTSLTSTSIPDFISLRRTEDKNARETAARILSDVQSRGFSAIAAYSRKFDAFNLTKQNCLITREEFDEAASRVTPGQRQAMRKMKGRLESFALLQKSKMDDVSQKSKDGTTTLKFMPVERVGIYVPAGRAPLFSSLFMAAVPACIAGVQDLVVCTPPQKDGKANPFILAAARMCGIDKVCKLGGVQAIGAMAFGVEGLIRPVDVVCGPGNAYVSAAKQIVASSGVRIDVPAGPSEVLVIADQSANPSFVAADMLAQAEHGADSAAICICTSMRLAERVSQELAAQLASLPTQNPARQSIPKWGRIFVVRDIDVALDAANALAPEHLELMVADALKWLPKIKNAGAVFLATGEAFCDYGMGCGNHILPTNSSARAWGGVSVQTFGKWMYVESLSAGAQQRLACVSALLARIEGLEAHARAAEKRAGGD
ncbi:MAG: histidinol dehydrogenase [Candidatus Burarchaeum sp.]|nr:histidinol dehydrogenase [Candidatus Burarchaeum sp.]MDO8339184.1 histidinol dehydrogenase [Candidatus Burarchaeum sp.]